MLVPMPRSHAEELSLQHHAAYESLRMKQGSEHGLATLLQMVVVTAFVDEARRHELRTDVIKVAEQAINEALERGRAGAGWFLDGQGEEIIAALIAWHDDQLRNAPLTTFAEALERLEYLRPTSGRDHSLSGSVSSLCQSPGNPRQATVIPSRSVVGPKKSEL
jgi:type II secretory pathway pseudopilin PulG